MDSVNIKTKDLGISFIYYICVKYKLKIVPKIGVESFK